MEKDQVKDFISEQVSGAEVISEVLDVLLYQLPRGEDPVQLGKFFDALENNKKALGVKDYSVGMTTLEEVFLNISKSEEAKKTAGGTAVAHIHPETNDLDEDNKGSNVGFRKQFNALLVKTLR